MASPTGRKPRLAVLVSGRGSNLQAVLDAIADGRLDADIVGVFSDRPGAAALDKVAPGLRWSRAARGYPDRAAFDAELADALEATAPDWVFCAGYMRILGDAFVRRFDGRLLNVHPSLLPRYRGLHTHARALEAGDAEQVVERDREEATDRTQHEPGQEHGEGLQGDRDAGPADRDGGGVGADGDQGGSTG